MKLVPKAKPVRIRITSCRKDNSTLDDLRKNFSLADIIPLVLDKRLSRWLVQINEPDLAKEVDELKIGKNLGYNCMNLLSLFYDEITVKTDPVDAIIYFKKNPQLSQQVAPELCEVLAKSGKENILYNAIARLVAYFDDKDDVFFGLCEAFCELTKPERIRSLADRIPDVHGRVKSFLFDQYAQAAGVGFATVSNGMPWVPKTDVWEVTNVFKSLEFGKRKTPPRDFDIYRKICKSSVAQQAIDLLEGIYKAKTGMTIEAWKELDKSASYDGASYFLAQWGLLKAIVAYRKYGFIDQSHNNNYRTWMTQHPYLHPLLETYISSYRWGQHWYFMSLGVQKLVQAYECDAGSSFLQNILNGQYEQADTYQMKEELAREVIEKLKKCSTAYE